MIEEDLHRLAHLLTVRGLGYNCLDDGGAAVSEIARRREGEPVVLFVCVHNAGRSQMAAAFLEELAGDRVRVRSAGITPAEEIHPVVVDAMREAGIELVGRTPAGLLDHDVRKADVVVTMGCGDECPVYPGRRYEDWDLPDPTGRPLKEVREIRDEIRRRVKALLPTPAPGGAA